jgi:N-acetylneuraminic acid mutarotase
MLLGAIAAGLAPISGAVASGKGTATPATGRGWHTLPPLPVARSEFAAAVIDRHIIVAGGFGAGTRVDQYNPAAETWTRLADLPVAVHHPGVAALGGTLYVAGGYTGDDSHAVDHVWAYDPTRDSWTARTPIPVARGAFGLVPFGGKLYAIGGARERLGGPVTGAVDVYDPAADRWRSATTMLTPREHLAVVATHDRIFAIGGRANGDEDDQFAAANEAYDPVADRWDDRARLPVPRGGLSGVFVAGRVVVLGGERGSHLYDDVNSFEPATNNWAPLPALPVALHGLATAAIDDALYAIGGSTLAQRVRNSAVVERLDLTESPSF